MLTSTVTVGDYEFEFTVPPTARDVLDWFIWARMAGGDSLESTLIEMARRGLAWAAQWLCPVGDWTGDELAVLIGELVEPEEYMGAVVQLCDAIANSAGLAPDVLDDVRVMLDKQNEVPPDYKPDGICSCARCRRGIENPRGMACVYDGFDHRAIEAAALASQVDDGSERYYLTQIRALMQRAEARRVSFERKKRDEREEYERIMKSKGLMRG